MLSCLKGFDSLLHIILYLSPSWQWKILFWLCEYIYDFWWFEAWLKQVKLQWIKQNKVWVCSGSWDLGE